MKKMGGALPVVHVQSLGRDDGHGRRQRPRPVGPTSPTEEKAELWSELEPLLPQADRRPVSRQREVINGRPHAPWLNGNREFVTPRSGPRANLA